MVIKYKKTIAQGAESIIYLDGNVIIKDRIPKRYRLKEIDERLRKFRTKREAKVIEKLPVPKPKLISVDDREMKIEMEFIEGDLLRDYLNEKNFEGICREIGLNAVKMHDAGIIHGDLTTSNMILGTQETDKQDLKTSVDFFSPPTNVGEKKSRNIATRGKSKGVKKVVHFIDFGLSFFSEKVEDKAVDIHLFRQALESKHYKFWERAFKAFLIGYKSNSKYDEIMKRLEKVEARGRYKGKG